VLRTFQTPQVHDRLTCLENVLVGLPDRNLRTLPVAWFRRRAMLRAERARWERACGALEFAGLSRKAEAEAGALSYGERRRLELARVYALLLVEHKIDFLESLCHRMIVLELGQEIASGEPAAVWADPKVVNAYLGAL
jgi:ABC-type branched-subunit amino acid transport system ATPase component